MWQALIGYFVLVGLRVLLNNHSLRNYLKLPLVEQPSWAGRLPSVSIVGPAPEGLDYPNLADADGDWLLLVAKGVTLKPGALDRMMRFALERQAKAVSIFLQQRCVSFWERTVIPYSWQQAFVARQSRARGDCSLLDREARAAEAAMLARGERLGEAPARVAEPSGALTACSILLSALAIPCAAYGLASGSQAFELAALVTYVSSVAELALWQFLFGAPLSYALLQPLAVVLFLPLAAHRVRAAGHDPRRPGGF